MHPAHTHTNTHTHTHTHHKHTGPHKHTHAHTHSQELSCPWSLSFTLSYFFFFTKALTKTTPPSPTIVEKKSTFEISQYKQTLSHMRGDLSLYFPLSHTHMHTRTRERPGFGFLINYAWGINGKVPCWHGPVGLGWLGWVVLHHWKQRRL